MADAFTTWITNFLSTSRLLNASGGAIWLISGSASTLAINIATDPAPVHIWFHPFFTPLAIFGAAVVIVNVVGGALKRLIADLSTAIRNKRYRRKASKIAIKNLDSLSLEEAQGLIWLLNFNRRFTANAQNPLLLKMMMRNLVLEAKWEDGVWSADTFLIDEAIWREREVLKLKYAKIKKLDGNPFVRAGWMAV